MCKIGDAFSFKPSGRDVTPAASLHPRLAVQCSGLRVQSSKFRPSILINKVLYSHSESWCLCERNDRWSYPGMHFLPVLAVSDPSSFDFSTFRRQFCFRRGTIAVLFFREIARFVIFSRVFRPVMVQKRAFFRRKSVVPSPFFMFFARVTCCSSA